VKQVLAVPKQTHFMQLFLMFRNVWWILLHVFKLI